MRAWHLIWSNVLPWGCIKYFKVGYLPKQRYWLQWHVKHDLIPSNSYNKVDSARHYDPWQQLKLDDKGYPTSPSNVYDFLMWMRMLHYTSAAFIFSSYTYCGWWGALHHLEKYFLTLKSPWNLSHVIVCDARFIPPSILRSALIYWMLINNIG